jgi:hypothetical protein
MQTNELHWHLVYLCCSRTIAATRCIATQANMMSQTASAGFIPSGSLFGRLLTTIDRLLMAHARIAIRNGDLPYPGL